MPVASLPFILTTNKNVKNDVLEASVVANYGDPGLDEDFFADILSRYVICMIESSNRVLTDDRWRAGMIVLVKRPETLWVQYQNNTFVNNPQSQVRVDYNLNSNSGPANSYSIDAIPRINNPYQLGEKIKIKKIPIENNFYSACGTASHYYNPWHIQGAANLNYLNVDDVPNTLRQSVLTSSNTFSLNKAHYEAFALTVNTTNPDAMKRLFAGNSRDGYYYRGNGGYLFRGDTQWTKPINICQYEDMNVGNKARTPSNSCIPLVVTTPNSFTVPAVRSVGTVNYTPTYIGVIN